MYAVYIFSVIQNRFPQVSFIKEENLAFEEHTLKIAVINEIQLEQIQFLYKIFDKYFKIWYPYSFSCLY